MDAINGQQMEMERVKHMEPIEHEEEAVPLEDLPKVRSWTVALAALIVVAALIGLFLLGYVPRERRLRELNSETAAAQDARPTVEVATPKRSATAVELILPADARPMQETAVYPRTSGYLKRLLVDIGDHVKAGQLLAEIDTPEVDADLAQAQAAVGQAQANAAKAQGDYELAQNTLKRYEGFATTGGLTEQQLEEKRVAFTEAKSALDAAKANVTSAQATVQKLTALQGFEKIVAPFAGTVTSRNYDVGALMSPTNTGAGKELFRIEQTDTLRAFVNVPQAYVTSDRTGQKAFLTVRNYPGRDFVGTIARSSGSLDPATRTLRYEIDFPNAEGTLLAGMYAQVRLSDAQEQPPMVVPTSALVFDSGGTRVWVVDDGKVHFKKIEVGRDLGTEVEIASGLSGQEAVVTNPGERLSDGVEVQIARANPPAGPQQQAAAR